jgi:hypothetical protein
MKHEEREAGRSAEMKRAQQQITVVQKIHRELVNGRPLASEVRTPHAAVMAAGVLYQELQIRMITKGLNPELGDWAVSIGYVSSDLSFYGLTDLFTPGEEPKETLLTGNIPIGLLFGMVDKEAKEADGRFVIGFRAFIATKQTATWLEGLEPAFRLEMQDPD